MRLLSGNLTLADRHGAVQVVRFNNGDLTNNPTTGHSNTLITGPVEIEIVSETK